MKRLLMPYLAILVGAGVLINGTVLCTVVGYFTLSNTICSDLTADSFNNCMYTKTSWFFVGLFMCVIISLLMSMAYFIGAACLGICEPWEKDNHL